MQASCCAQTRWKMNSRTFLILWPKWNIGEGNLRLRTMGRDNTSSACPSGSWASQGCLVIDMFNTPYGVYNFKARKREESPHHHRIFVSASKLPQGEPHWGTGYRSPYFVLYTAYQLRFPKPNRSTWDSRRHSKHLQRSSLPSFWVRIDVYYRLQPYWWKGR